MSMRDDVFPDRPLATLLSRAGIAPRVAQAAMRHSTIDPTMSVYTDPRLLDVAGALDVLPELPLEATPEVSESLARQFAS